MHVLGENKRYAEAADVQKLVVQQKPDSAEEHNSLGWAYFKLGKLNEAEIHLTNAGRINTASPTVQEHLGDLYQKQGKADQARAAWQKALTLSVEAGQTIRLKTKLNVEKKR